MNDTPPPIWRAFGAAERQRLAEFDWGEWSVQAFRQMRRGWLGYIFFSGIVATMFSCTSAQMDAQAEASGTSERHEKVDPWALEKPAEPAR